MSAPPRPRAPSPQSADVATNGGSVISALQAISIAGALAATIA